jgi:thiol-disulfide isomerase/thioredoxin
MMQNEQLSIGTPFPGFSGLRGVDGATHDAAEYLSAKVLVVVFSCNHCPYVQAYEGRMSDFQRAYGGKGVQLIAINANDTKNYPDDDYPSMVKRAKSQGFAFVYLRDEDQSVAGRFRASHTPEFYVFGGPEKRLVYHGKMDDNYQNPGAVTQRYLQEAVDAVLAGKPVAVPETHSIGCTIKWR